MEIADLHQILEELIPTLFPIANLEWGSTLIAPIEFELKGLYPPHL